MGRRSQDLVSTGMTTRGRVGVRKTAMMAEFEFEFEFGFVDGTGKGKGEGPMYLTRKFSQTATQVTMMMTGSSSLGLKGRQRVKIMAAMTSEPTYPSQHGAVEDSIRMTEAVEEWTYRERK